MANMQELLQAAAIISKTEIREEDVSRLLTHRSEFETAFQKLHALLGPSSVSFPIPAASPTDDISVPSGLPTPELSEQCSPMSETPTRSLPESTPPTLTNHVKAVDTEVMFMEAVPDSAQQVLRLLNKRKRTISAFTYRSEIHHVYPGHEHEDIRVTIIKFVSHKRTDSDYYLAGRAALSLADDFLLWQRQVGIPGRLDVLSNNINDKTGACYQEYAKNCSSFRDKERAAEYIEFGVKLRFFASLCYVRYRGPITCAESISIHCASFSNSSDFSDSSGSPDTSNSSDPDTFSDTGAPSALNAPPSSNPDPTEFSPSSSRPSVVYPLFFVWRAFYRCRYCDLPALASALLSWPDLRELAEAKDWQKLDNPLFAVGDPPIEYAVPSQNRKRTLIERSWKERPKRQRVSQLQPHPPGSPPSLRPRILPLGPQRFPNPGQYSSVPDIPPDEPQIVPDRVQYATTRDTWEFGSPMLPNQPQGNTPIHIWPLGSGAFPDRLQIISASDSPTPQGLNLSTPEIANAVDNMLRTLETTMDNQCAS
ncbi:hypothetical protein CBS147353_11399 [Aspergillus niger]|nr:hypothetical protein CBS147353_11399 [Aspergillus niger]